MTDIQPQLATQADRLALAAFLERSGMDPDDPRLQSACQFVPDAPCWVVWRERAIVAAISASALGGGLILLRVPVLGEGVPAQVGTRLLQAADQWAQNQPHVDAAELLLETSDTSWQGQLIRLGYQQISNTLYMSCEAPRFPKAEPHVPAIWTRYQDAQFDELVQLVEETYVQSLDCPALDGTRSTKKVVQGYQATGDYKPERWILAKDVDGGKPVACILWNAHAGQQWELVYLGVVPKARGQGIGLALTRLGLWQAGQAAQERAVVAVDDKNLPAIALYAKAGFMAWDARAVWLKSFQRD